MKIKFKTKFLYDENGNKKTVILSFNDFERLIEMLEDLKSIHKAQQRMGSKSINLISLEQIKKDLGIDESQKQP